MPTRVLIIDDDRDTAEFLKLLVEPRGDLARTASDAAQAKEILRAWRPEVAFLRHRPLNGPPLIRAPASKSRPASTPKSEWNFA